VVAIPKATSRAHIEANAAVFAVELTDAETRKVAEASPGLRNRLYNLGPTVVRLTPFDQT
jgi:diketogulonate reductase-like aldo/keto reductase